MDYGILFKMEHSRIKEKTNVKIKESALLEELRKNGIDTKCFYQVKDKLYKYCYEKDYLLLPIYSELNLEGFNALRIIDTIKARERKFKEILSKCDYYSFFALIDKPCRPEWFKNMYDEIPNSMKYKLFCSIYANLEYDIEIMDGMISDIIKMKPEEDNNTEEMILTIYRGQGSKSREYTTACAWTTDIEEAERFATRFGEEGRIYKAKTSDKNVIHIGRENTILVLPKDVMEVSVFR